MSSQNPRKILIADSDRDFLVTLSNDPAAEKIPPIVAHTGKEAQLHLANTSNTFLGVFLSLNLKDPSVVFVARFSKRTRPSTPIFLIHGEENLPFSEKELKEMGIHKTVKKPVTFLQLSALVASQLAEFDPQKAIEMGEKTAVGEEIESKEDALIPIRSSDFVAGKISYFDVFVRLGNNRFLKILKAGDNFSDDRLSNYIQKGVTHFFIRKEAQAQYLAYCEKVVKALLSSTNHGASIKVSQLLNYGEETFKFLQGQGVSDSNLTYANEFIHATEKLARQLNPGKYPLIKGFLGDVAAYQHGVAVTMLSSLMLQSFQISSAEPVETVGIAALFHDVGLKILELNALDHDTEKMTETQVRTYRSHPTVGADYLKTVRGIKPVVIQAIAQHHERRNKKGFPLQIGAGSISMVGEIIGICNEFFHVIKKLRSGEKFNLSEELQKNIFSCFSHPMLTEFKKVFLLSNVGSGPSTGPSKDDNPK